MSEKFSEIKNPVDRNVNESIVNQISIPVEYEQIYQMYYNPPNQNKGYSEAIPPDRGIPEENASFTTSGTIFQMNEVVSQTTTVKHWSKPTKGGLYRGPGSYEKNRIEEKTKRDDRIREAMKKNRTKKPGI
jgi:hypothetical protein